MKTQEQKTIIALLIVAQIITLTLACSMIWKNIDMKERLKHKPAVYHNVPDSKLDSVLLRHDPYDTVIVVNDKIELYYDI